MPKPWYIFGLNIYIYMVYICSISRVHSAVSAQCSVDSRPSIGVCVHFSCSIEVADSPDYTALPHYHTGTNDINTRVDSVVRDVVARAL